MAGESPERRSTIRRVPKGEEDGSPEAQGALAKEAGDELWNQRAVGQGPGQLNLNEMKVDERKIERKR